jgi:MtN3 and saliva related transmembrane protein
VLQRDRSRKSTIEKSVLVVSRMLVKKRSRREATGLRYIGTLAAICTTTAFIPQILKIRRQGGEDLSYPMLLVYLTGTLLWLAYGLLLHAAAVIWANASTALLVLVAVVMKATYAPKDQTNS